MDKADALQAEREQYGRRLHELREAAGLTMADLSRRSTIRQSAISRAEKGRGFLERNSAEKIAAALNCDPLEIGPPKRRQNWQKTEKRKAYEARYAGWGQRIREQRKAAGLTQMQLAKLLCVDQTTIGAWERGPDIPREADRQRLHELLGIGEPGEPDGPMGPEVMQIIMDRQEAEERARREQQERAAAAKAAAEARRAEKEKAQEKAEQAAEARRQARQAEKAKRQQEAQQGQPKEAPKKRGRPPGRKQQTYVPDPTRLGPISTRGDSWRDRYAGYGRQVRERREAAGLSVPELAQLADTTVQVVNKWESGQVIPSDANRQKLGELIGVKEPPAVVEILPAESRKEPKRAELPSDRLSCYAREAAAAGVSYGRWMAATTEMQRDEIWAAVEHQRRLRREKRKAARKQAAEQN